MNSFERKLQRQLEICAQEIEDGARTRGLLDKPLRFGRDRIVISDIGQAYFCEKKLDFDYGAKEEREKLPVEEKEELDKAMVLVQEKQDKGIVGHEAIALTSGHIEEAILRMIYRDTVLVSGIVDEIQTDSQRITAIERKFREPGAIPKRDPYLEHMAQARVYCSCLSYMLDRLQMSSISIFYDVAYYPKQCSECLAFLDNECGKCSIREFFTCYSYPFTDAQLAKSNDEVDFVLSYWLQQRDAKPTKYPNKCKKCEYRQPTVCLFSLA